MRNNLFYQTYNLLFLFSRRGEITTKGVFMKKMFFLFPFLFLLFLFTSCDLNFPYKPQRFVTPLPPAPKNGFVSKSELANFTNATTFKFAYTLDINGVRNVFYVDFSDSPYVPKKLKKPAGRENWNADSPIFSYDGNLITYFLNYEKQFASYVQTLDTSSEPVLIADNSSEPHFYKDENNNLFIIYADTGGKLDNQLEYITNKGTYKQQIDPISGQKIGNPVQIANKPFFGGISKDGKYLCTAYSNAYIYEINTQTLFSINTGKQTCNPSISPDLVFSDRMMFLNINGPQNLKNDPYGGKPIAQHKVIFIVDKSNTVVNSFDVDSVFSSQRTEWQDPEYTNHPDFFCALAKDNADGWDAFLICISKKTALMINNLQEIRLNETSTPYMYIGGAL
jgi:hypothetical protein